MELFLDIIAWTVIILLVLGFIALMWKILLVGLPIIGVMWLTFWAFHRVLDD